MANNLHIFFATTGVGQTPSNQISETVFPAAMPNPDFVQGSGVTGFVDVDRLFIGNSGATNQYDGLTLSSTNDTANNDVKFAKDTAPSSGSGTAGAYADSQVYAAATTLTFRDGTSSQFVDPNKSLPFFRKFTAVSGQPATRIKNIRHKLDSTEHAV